jgi:protein-S-isoprenylcysteine O-methyltransferase Ste14
MKSIAKQMLSFILPITALIIVTLSVENDYSARNLVALWSGLLLICTGLLIMLVTISSFIRIGKGTLAPRSPTKKLVITGMYSYVRNPMIMGVLLVLPGEALYVTSINIFLWAVIFFIINNIYFTFYEEPNLERRFGEEYKEYKKYISRWIPKLKPYCPDSLLKN